MADSIDQQASTEANEQISTLEAVISAENSTTNSLPTLILCEDGDIHLTVDENPQKRFLVSSAVLSNASQVFRAMFSDRYAEGQKLSTTTPAALTFHDDPEPGLEVLLRVIHFRFDSIESVLKVSDSYGFVQICDKYDCMEAIDPFFNVWLSTKQLPHQPLDDKVQLCLVAKFCKKQAYLDNMIWRISRSIGPTSLESMISNPAVLPPEIIGAIHSKFHAMKRSLKKIVIDFVEGRKRCSCHFKISALDSVRLMNIIDQSSTVTARNRVKFFIQRTKEENAYLCGRQEHVPHDPTLAEVKKEALALFRSNGLFVDGLVV
ncbi:Hypothetical protein D9617_13g100370 [Elsinoe fawcettii]|nr:Hypothetical protein D9617_13g100370 [Elsinoe fawcettii]